MASKLLDRGFDLTVIDRQPYAAMETSFANGGQLSAGNAEVWNSVPTVLKGLKWLFRKDAPLSVGLAPNWRGAGWPVSWGTGSMSIRFRAIRSR